MIAAAAGDARPMLLGVFAAWMVLAFVALHACDWWERRRGSGRR